MQIAKLLATLLLTAKCHRTDVLRRRARHDHHNADAQGGRQGSNRHHRLAEGEGPRRRTHTHAVGRPARRPASAPTRTPGCPSRRAIRSVNVAVESKEPNSELNWFKQVIALRHNNPALRNGSLTMLDPANPDVLSYVRSTGSGAAVVVAMNFTAAPKTISLDLSRAGVTGKSVKTLATDDPSLKSTSTLTNITLPPFASWIASVQ